MINPPKPAKNLNSHYFPVLNVFINTKIGGAQFKIFRILLDSGCGSTIVIRRLVEKLSLEKYDVMQWHMQAGNITTNLKVKVYFTLPTLRPTNVLMWTFHVDDFPKGIYDMILGRNILIKLGLNLKFLTTLSKQMMDLLKGLYHPWLIWVLIHLNA